MLLRDVIKSDMVTCDERVGPNACCNDANTRPARHEKAVTTQCQCAACTDAELLHNYIHVSGRSASPCNVMGSRVGIFYDQRAHALFISPNGDGSSHCFSTSVLS